MKWSSFIIMAAATLLLQVSIIPFIAIGPQNVKPDILLLTGLLIAFRTDSYDNALLQCWIIGIIHDMNSANPFGIYSLCLGCAALFVVWFRKWFMSNNLLLIMLWVFICTTGIENIAILAVIWKKQISIENYKNISQMIWFSAAYTSALAPYLQIFIRRKKWNLQ